MQRKKLLTAALTTACMLTIAGCGSGYGTTPVPNNESSAVESASTQQEEVQAESTAAPEAETTQVDAPAAEAPARDATVTETPAQNAPAAPAQTASQAAQAATITEADAKKIALDHAGLAESDVTFILSHPDFDDGRYVYDVEFYQEMKEYDYEIDANTGDILSFDFDIESYFAQAPAQTTPAVQPPSAAAVSAALSVDDAKRIALQQAGVSEADAVITKAKYDYDDGIAVYDIEFVSGTTEYETEIDANTGAVREFDAESVYD